MRSLLLTILLSYLLLTSANQCSVSIIGSGLSGVYTAYRLASANETEYPPYEICIFDSTSNFGGRVLTVQNNQGDLFEMGIDSFDRGKNPLFSELVDYLGLETACLWEGEAPKETEYKEPEVEKSVPEKETVEVEKTVPVEVEKTVEVAKDTEAEVAVEESVPPEETTTYRYRGGQKRQEVKTNEYRDTAEDEKVIKEEEKTIIKPADEPKTGYQDKTGEETATYEEEKEHKPAEFTSGVPEEEKAKECRPELIRLMYLRNKIVYKNTSEEELPYRLTQTVDKLKDLPNLAFNTVMGDKISSEDFESIRSDPDAASRWESISGLIEEIKSGNIKYKDVPINQIDMGMVLADALDLNEDDIEASIYLSDKYPRLKDLMSMNFELFAIQHLRNVAAGKEDLRKIDSFNGLSSVIDIMASELEDKGVQIYHNAKLDNVKIVGDTILLHFAGLAGVVPTKRVFFAINKKELLGLGSSDVLEKISDPANEVLGSLKSLKMVKGVVLYETSWWKDYDIGDAIYTDTNLNKLSFHTIPDCPEGEKCAGWIKFEHWGDRENLNYDIFNPIGMATVLTEFNREQSDEYEAGEANVESNTTDSANIERPSESNRIPYEAERNPSSTETPKEYSSERTDRTPSRRPESTERTPSRRPESEEWEGIRKEHSTNETSGDSFSLFDLETFERGEELRSQFILNTIHNRLMNIFKEVPGFDPAQIEPPVSVLIANWQDDGRYEFGTVSLPSRVPYKDRVLSMVEPIPGAAVHFVDSDFSEFTNWDHSFESSIVMVERALNQVLGMERPAWNVDEQIYKAVVEV